MPNRKPAQVAHDMWDNVKNRAKPIITIGAICGSLMAIIAFWNISDLPVPATNRDIANLQAYIDIQVETVGNRVEVEFNKIVRRDILKTRISTLQLVLEKLPEDANEERERLIREIQLLIVELNSI